MSLTLSQIANNTASLTLHIGDDTLTIIYYPAHLTEQFLAQVDGFDISTLQSTIAGFGSLNDMLSRLVKSWDLFEDDGTTMYPIVPERLAELPISFRMQVFQALMGDIRPEAMTPKIQN